MDRELLPHLPVLLAVARRASFSAAAAELGMGASSVSHAVRVVEERLGTPVFLRTTRSVALTEAGTAFVEAAEAALAGLIEAWEGARSRRTQASGLLRINAPRLAMPWLLGPILDGMAARFPDVTVEIRLDDGLADVVGQGFDAGIRLAGMVAQEMVAVRLTAPFRAIIVATPGYLDARGVPTSLAELAAHNCIGYRLETSRALYRWDLQDGGRDVQHEVRGSPVVSDMVAAIAAAQRGLGLAYVFAPLAELDLAAGRLVEVLPRAAVEEPGMALYYPRVAARAPKLRALIDVARSAFRTA